MLAIEDSPAQVRTPLSRDDRGRTPPRKTFPPSRPGRPTVAMEMGGRLSLAGNRSASPSPTRRPAPSAHLPSELDRPVPAEWVMMGCDGQGGDLRRAILRS